MNTENILSFSQTRHPTQLLCTASLAHWLLLALLTAFPAFRADVCYTNARAIDICRRYFGRARFALACKHRSVAVEIVLQQPRVKDFCSSPFRAPAPTTPSCRFLSRLKRLQISPCLNPVSDRHLLQHTPDHTCLPQPHLLSSRDLSPQFCQ